MNKSKHSSTLAMLDFLFNLVLAFVSLVILLLLQVKTSESHAKMPENKNEFIVQMEWNSGTDDDIDLWARDPAGNIVGFRKKEVAGIMLQRDDTGRKNKLVAAADGTITEEPRNSETLNISKVVPGTYTFNVHFYRPDIRAVLSAPDSTVTVLVKVIKINPYSELPPVTLVLPRGSTNEVTALSLEVDKDGKVLSTNRLPINFVLDTIGSGQL